MICLEEPELGLHPDILPGLADLLREASERCQLIVTTHSDTLVDALTDTPESIVICEKESGQTRLKRLDKKELSHWLEKYRLGELWTSGRAGGEPLVKVKVYVEGGGDSNSLQDAVPPRLPLILCRRRALAVECREVIACGG